jgi:hypothetical protein
LQGKRSRRPRCMKGLGLLSPAGSRARLLSAANPQSATSADR